MAYNSKYTGSEVEALLDKVQDTAIPTKTSELENDSGFITAAALDGKQDVLTAGANITIAGDVISASPGGLWNVYCFVGGDADSVVTIDGVDITVAAGATVQGSFTADISAIPTNNLRRIIIRGDVSLSISSNGASANSTLEEVDVEFSPSFVRSLDYFCYNLQGLRRLRIAGGKPSGAQYMCQYVGLNTDAGCLADLHDIDFSAMTSSNGCRYLCAYGKWESVDLSGSTFGGGAYNMFYRAAVGSADVSGCTFGGEAYNMFYGAAVQSVDLSGSTFSSTAADMFNGATVGSADVSGSTFGGTAGYMFQGATVGSADVSGSTFGGDAYSMFYQAEVGSADVSGCTFNGDAYNMFYRAAVGSADVSGCTFGGEAYNMFYQAAVQSADVSGCTFNGTASSMFYGATVGSADVSGCTFSADARSMFNGATVGSADVSGCTFGGDAYYMFYKATVGSADVSGCTFGGNAYEIFYHATIERVSLAGTDLRAAVVSNVYMWESAEIKSLDLDGITLPTDDTYCWNFVNYMNSAAKIGTITGDWGEITDYRDISLSALELRRNSTVGVFNALPVSKNMMLTIAAYSGARVTDYDIAIATNKGWTVAY